MSYLTRTGVSSTNGGQHNTISFWFKRSNDLGNTADYIFGAEVDGNNYTWVRTENQRLEYISATGGIVKFKLSTSALFRDPTAWYHVVLRSSTTSGTSSNRIRMYVNGSQVTDFNTATYPDQNYFSYLCDNNTNMYVGRSSGPFGGLVADVNLLDGEDQAASKFGETDSTTGIWKPKPDFTGINYGNNGFRLQFENIFRVKCDLCMMMIEMTTKLEGISSGLKVRLNTTRRSSSEMRPQKFVMQK